MNELIVPPSPNWYNNSVFVCTSDNTVIYGSRKDIVIINPNENAEVGDIKIIHSAHNNRIISVSPNNEKWNNPEKLLASIGEDQVVKLWDLNTYTLKDSHKGHENTSDILVGVSLAGDRVISVTENFNIIVWRLSTDTLVVIPNLITGKVIVKGLATCPHAPWLTAFGLNNGLVVLADLRKEGKVLYKFRANESDITSMAWCPTPFNIFDPYIAMKTCMARKSNDISPTDFMKRDDSEGSKTSLSNGHAENNASGMLSSESTGTRNNKSTNYTPEELINIHIEAAKLTNKSNIQTKLCNVIDIPDDHADFKNKCPIVMEMKDKPANIQIDTIQLQDALANIHIDPNYCIIDKKDEATDKEIKPTQNMEIGDEVTDTEIITTNIMESKDLVENLLERNICRNDQFREISTDIVIDEQNTNSLKTRVMEMAEAFLDDNNCDVKKEVLLKDNYEIDVPDKFKTSVIDEVDLDKYMCGIERLKNVEEKQIDLGLLKLNNKIEIIDNIQADMLEVPDAVLTEIQEKHNTSNMEDLESVDTENDGKKTMKEMLMKVRVGTYSKETDSSSEDFEKAESRFISEGPTTEYLLATACKSGIICIWRAATDGRLQLTLPKLPTRQKSSARSNNNDKRNNWISLCWVQPDVLISSSSRNDIYAWNLISNTEPKKKLHKKLTYTPRFIHADHRRNVFVIASPYYIYSYDEIFTSHNYIEDISIWTMSQDRWLICSDLGKRRVLHASISTMGGYIMHLAGSPLDPTRVAVGIGDSSIRVWELSSCKSNSINMRCLCDKIKSKVTFLDWHPVKDNCLAFATTEGQLGEFDLNNMSKAPVVYSYYHRDQIYRIQWGPLPEKTDEINGLYSCSKGEFTVHNSSKPTGDPFKLPVGDCKVQTFAWKTDFSLLAIGTKEGHVKVLTKDFVSIQTLYMQNKSIQCVAWHPISTVADSGVSLYANDLAVSTNEPVIVVYRCSDGNKTENDAKVIASLRGHTSCVKYLSWCPHISGRLVSIGEDGAAMVWDVHSQTLLSTFKGHGGQKHSINCVMWSPLDADLILTGGKDCAIRIWRITKNPPVPLATEEIKKKKSPKNPNQEPSQIVVDKDPLMEDKKNTAFYALPSVSRLQNPEIGFTIQTCRKLLEKLKSASNGGDVSLAEKDQSVASNVINTTENDDSLIEKDKISIDSSKSFDVTQLFGSREDIISLLNYEQQSHMSKKRWEMSHHLALWKGDLAESIQQAVKSNVLNPWVISMAPMVSHKLWSQLCLSYAEKLVEDGNGMLASSYFLACHKVHDAIDALCNSNLYREAISLTQCKLPGDSIIDSILEKWAQYSTKVGNYEIAAQCYIKLNKLSEAGELLNKRPDVESLEMAAELAKRSNNSDLYNTITMKLDALKQLKPDVPENPVINICESRFKAIINQSKIEMSSESESDNDANNTDI